MPGKLVRLSRNSTIEPSGRGGLVLLHGLGSDEKDLMEMSGGIDRAFGVVSLRAPLAYEYGGFSWFGLNIDQSGISYDLEQAKASLSLLQEEIPRIADELEISSSRLILGGFSQGAVMSLAVALNSPELVGGILLMSGAVLPGLLPGAVSQCISGLPALIQHGAYDPVLPVQLGREVIDTLIRYGGNPEYREYPMGHQVSAESLNDAEQWLSARLA